MKTAAIIQARMGSTRLPGKVAMKLMGQSVLGHIIRRVRTCRDLDEIIVATTKRPEDDAVVREATRAGATVSRGSEHDVLERYYRAAHHYQVDTVVRITGDCPLHDPELLSGMLTRFQELVADGIDADYLSNTLKRTFPVGLDTEIFTFEALARAQFAATQAYEREHVTPYIYQHPDSFALHDYTNDTDLSRHRWTLDTPEDLQFVEAVYGHLYQSGAVFSTAAVLRLLAEAPDLSTVNAHVRQKALGE